MIYPLLSKSLIVEHLKSEELVALALAILFSRVRKGQMFTVVSRFALTLHNDKYLMTNSVATLNSSYGRVE